MQTLSTEELKKNGELLGIIMDNMNDLLYKTVDTPEQKVAFVWKDGRVYLAFSHDAFEVSDK